MFSFSPFSAASPISGLVALDFGPAALIVGAVLLMIGAWLATQAERAPEHAPPRPPGRRSNAAVQLRRLGRNLGRRPERRAHAATLLRPV
jgi:hypothetical protein